MDTTGCGGTPELIAFRRSSPLDPIIRTSPDAQVSAAPSPADLPTESFYRENARWLAAGLLCTFGSSFGQTFFISLFADRLMALHGLSDGEWGTLYTAATLTSAALLVQAGRLADSMALQRLILAVLLLYALVALGMAFNSSLILLFVLIAGLRFCGQGMISHIGITATARWFRARRGRALAVTGFGYSLGEAVLPSLAVAAIALVGWRSAWGLVAALLLFGFAPLLGALLAEGRAPKGAETHVAATGLGGRHWSRADALRHWLFWALVPGILTPSFIGTVIFFHQIHISEEKGWDIATMALGYPIYAGLTVLAMIAAGQFIDRRGAASLLPLYLLPLGCGIALIDQGSTVWTWYAVLAFLGIGQGLGNTLTGALRAEVYGTRHIGAVRALTVSVMVCSTAVGPGVTGLLIDAGIPFPEQGLAMALWCFVLSASFVLVTRRLARERLTN